MTYEEAAKETVIKLHCNVCDSLNCATVGCFWFVIKNALEKQIPKKPKLYEYTEKPFPVCCPCCGDLWNYNEYGAGMKFCWECGQAIDWSDEE